MRILVIQTAFIGDLIMSTPIFRALKEIYPNAEIDALVIPSSAVILKHNPFVNQIITFDKKSGFFGKIISFFKTVSTLRKRKYDLAISIQYSITSSLLMLLSGISRRIGSHRMKLITDIVQIPKGLHNRQRVLTLLKPLSNSSFSEETEIFLSEAELSRAEAIVKAVSSETNIKIAIAPGSVRQTKKWLPEYFAELTSLLADAGFDVFFIGSKDEKELCESIIKSSGARRAFNYAGELNLLESAALISMSNLLVCNDSSPLHLANAVKTDVFAFFGPTVRRFGCYPYRPYDKMLEVELECRPCDKHGGEQCPLVHHNCMKSIKPEYVANLIFLKSLC